MGTGEGGSVALLMSLIWRELISGVASIDGPLAGNLNDMPVDLQPAAGLPVMLIERRSALASSSITLAARGASVRIGVASDESLVRWVTNLPA